MKVAPDAAESQETSVPEGASVSAATALSEATAVSAARLLALAIAADVRIAVAESLTGGLLADALVTVPGASRAFSGGIVAYDTALKSSLLRVDGARLRETGPVDELVAEQMARGVRVVCGVPERGGDAELGLSTTGVAGPDADPQSGQPAGVVWVGVSFRESSKTVRLALEGDRDTIRRAAVLEALRAGIQALEQVDSSM